LDHELTIQGSSTGERVMIALEEDEETETLATSPQVAAKPALSRDEYFIAAYDYIPVLVRKAKREGLSQTDAETLADKVFDWTIKDYERNGDLGRPYFNMDRYINRELERYQKIRGDVVRPVGAGPEDEWKFDETYERGRRAKPHKSLSQRDKKPLQPVKCRI
jgi:hypothetical protein